MIVVDTNVVSELAKPAPNTAVVHWFERFGPVAALPTVVVAELYAGLELMADGARKSAVRRKYDAVIDLLAERTLTFDVSAAMEFSRLVARCRRRDIELKSMDTQIAAIARVHRTPIATRDFKDFSETGVKLINPWDDE